MGDDYLEVTGGINQNDVTAKITTAMDHRIAMSFVMGLKWMADVKLTMFQMIQTSFPNFENIFANFGISFN